MNKRISLKFKKADIIVFVSMILLIISMSLSLLIFNKNTKKDAIVTVTYYGEVVHTMKLDEDEVFEMTVADYPKLLGDMIITVEDGKVSVDKQTSYHNYCQIMGDITKSGTSLICAPNGVTVTIEGYDATEEDFILK